MSTITLGELEATLRAAGRDVDKAVAPVVRRTANKAMATQRATVPRKSGRTRDSIKATGPDGASFGPRTVDAEIGPTWFVGRFLEFGTATMSPRPFIAQSLEPHMATHLAEVSEAVAAMLMRRIPGTLTAGML